MRAIVPIIALMLAAPHAADAHPVARLEIFPGDRVLHAPANTQQLAVIAHFNDGSKRDVTHLTLFTTSDEEVATVSSKGLVTFWRTGDVAIFCRHHTLQSVRLTFVDEKPGFLWPKPAETNLVDQRVFAKLKQLRIAPSELCSDTVFLRRASIDLLGLWPTPAQLKRFMEDVRIDKRSRLIDELLDRPEHAELWAHHWGEMLALPVRQVAPKQFAAYLYWLRVHVRRDTPFDEVTRAIIRGQGIATGRGHVTFYTGGDAGPAEYATRVSEAFLGIRLQCVQCHLLPTTRQTPQDWHGFAGFFSQVSRVHLGKERQEIMLLDGGREWYHPGTRRPVPPRFLDGVKPTFQFGEDRRVQFADWLTSPKNPYFARTMVNRIWANVMSKGLAEPPEMLHELPFTANDALLDALAQEFVVQNYQVKQIIRILMNSRTYQLASEPNDFNKDDEIYFSRGYRPHLKSEVFEDVLTQFLEVSEKLDETPHGERAVHGFRERYDFAAFGVSRPARWSICEAERRREPNMASALHLMGSNTMQARVTHPRSRANRLLAEKRSDRDITDELFLASLSRLPNDKEREQVATHLAKHKERRRAFEDIQWALVNTREFLRRP
jgi:hypothetical protein